MNLILLRSDTSDVSPAQFIKFWSRFYDYPKEHLYTGNISRLQFHIDNLEQLFLWKNNMEFSSNKQTSIQRMLSKIDLLNELKLRWSDSGFNDNFGNISAIWQIFLMHIIQPKRFSIFDQHVYRAHRYLVNKRLEEIPTSNKKKIAYYKSECVPFYEDFEKKCGSHTSKEIDNALWSFGKFIKAHPHLF